MPVNPLNALSDTYNVLQNVQDQRTRTVAGRDPANAADILSQGGMLQESEALRSRQAQTQAALSAQQRQEAEQRTELLLRGVQALQGVPAEQRNQAFEQMAPVFGQFMTPDVIEQLRAADKSDQSLSTFGAALGAEAQKLQLFQTRGGQIIGVDPMTGAERSRIELPEQDPAAPNGYRWTQDGNLEAIPGGPADPRQTGSLAASRRAPRQGRSGGGSRSSGGSRPSAPAAPARKPWERF